MEHSASRNCIFSVDVEDWFHILDIPSAPDISIWHTLPSGVEANFRKMLDLFDRHDVKATCFFLGWVAEHYPGLIREAKNRGHEIASHGYAHQLVYGVDPETFRQDADRSKKILEGITGEAVQGYRASGFSVTEETPWFFEALASCGYRYDSSVFPATRGHGGMKTGQKAPHRINTAAGDIWEFPMSVARTAGKPVCFFGGGYLRLFPYSAIRNRARQVLNEGRPVIFYIHPREIDPEHPRLPMSFTRRFKSYVNLASTEPKMERLFADFRFITFRDWLKEHDDTGKNQSS